MEIDFKEDQDKINNHLKVSSQVSRKLSMHLSY